MLLTIDIGNTQTVLGLFSDEELDHTWRIATYDTRTADELAVLINSLLSQTLRRSWAQLPALRSAPPSQQHCTRCA